MHSHLITAGYTAGRDYEIIISEQTPGYIFNKGAMFNVGYHVAKKVAKCDYMVLHDVDQVMTRVRSMPARGGEMACHTMVRIT